MPATPSSYLFALQRARGTERGVEGMWVRWRDGTRTLFIAVVMSGLSPCSALRTHLFTLVLLNRLGCSRLCTLVSYVARLVPARRVFELMRML